MTNREYLNNLKERFYERCGNFVEKHFNIICIVCYILDIVSFICMIKISFAFLIIVILLTIWNITLAYVKIEMWLDEERK